MKITFSARVRAFLQKNGESTIDQVVAAVSKYITAAQALRAYERCCRYNRKKYPGTTPRSPQQQVAFGKRKMVSECLKNLVRDRLSVVRVSEGVYRLAS